MKYKFSKTDRMRIVHEYETSELSYGELAKKYGISSAATIAKWRNRLQNSSKSITFATEKGKLRNMTDAERKEFESQIADLKDRLHKSEMHNLALEALIEVAEEQGLAIRKKCGAKQ